MSLKIGDRVFVIKRKEFGRIDRIIDDSSYFVSFANGIGFWFYRGELTEG